MDQCEISKSLRPSFSTRKVAGLIYDSSHGGPLAPIRRISFALFNPLQSVSMRNHLGGIRWARTPPTSSHHERKSSSWMHHSWTHIANDSKSFLLFTHLCLLDLFLISFPLRHINNPPVQHKDRNRSVKIDQRSFVKDRKVFLFNSFHSKIKFHAAQLDFFLSVKITFSFQLDSTRYDEWVNRGRRSLSAAMFHVNKLGAMKQIINIQSRSFRSSFINYAPWRRKCALPGKLQLKFPRDRFSSRGFLRFSCKLRHKPDSRFLEFQKKPREWDYDCGKEI